MSRPLDSSPAEVRLSCDRCTDLRNRGSWGAGLQRSAAGHGVWWSEQGLNLRRLPFQGNALPAELSNHVLVSLTGFEPVFSP